MASTFNYDGRDYNIELVVAMDNFAEELPGLYSKLGGYEQSTNANMNTFLTNLSNVISPTNVAYAIDIHNALKAAVTDVGAASLDSALKTAVTPENRDKVTKCYKLAAELHNLFRTTDNATAFLAKAALITGFIPIDYSEFSSSATKGVLLELQSVIPNIMNACSNFSDRRIDITIKLKTGGSARLTGRLSIPLQCNDNLIVKSFDTLNIDEYTQLKALKTKYAAIPCVLSLAAGIIARTTGNLTDFIGSSPKGNTVYNSDVDYLSTIRYAYPNQQFLETAISLIVYHYLQAVNSITQTDSTSLIAKSGPFNIEFVNIESDLASELVAHAMSETSVLLDGSLISA